MRKYGFDEKPTTILSAQAQQIMGNLPEREYSCLVGRNNSGKSFVLKQIYLQMRGAAAYLGPQRYNNFSQLAPYSPNKRRRADWWQQMERNLRQSNSNIDSSPFNVQQAIAELDNEKRAMLFEICKDVLGQELSLELAHPENDMSQRYISCNGHNFSFASSGVRLFVSIITSLFDAEFSHFLIDEPELGISPEAQNILGTFLLDKENRRKYFPHMKSILVATHSTQFLDRTDIFSNFTVQKTGDIIDINQVSSSTEFNKIHFTLLGNRLETLYLPSLIIIVEGQTDYQFVRRAVELVYPDLSFTVITAGSDGRMKNYAHMLTEFFPDFHRSPFRDRVMPILDSVHGSDIPHALLKKGIPEKSIVVWDKNGIEHYYPRAIIESIFGTADGMAINGDNVTVAGITLSKTDLAERVVGSLSENTEHHPEFRAKVLDRISEIA